MPTNSPWAWSSAHNRHYMYVYADDGVIQETLWSGPPASAGQPPPTRDPRDPRTTPSNPPIPQQVPRPLLVQPTQPNYTTGATSSRPVVGPAPPSTEGAGQAVHTRRKPVASLPEEVQANLHHLARRFIQTGDVRNETESLDLRYRRVATHTHHLFFVPGRVFMMLWTEPAGVANPGKTRNSTHFSTVWLNESAYSEIRRFVVVRNKGTFSQCIPIQTYRGSGATKPGLVMKDHGIIYTSSTAPSTIPGESLNKYPIRVTPTDGRTLDPASRVNYGKAYAVEHNVKVLDVGMVDETHRYMIEVYFESAMRGE
ncbi:hypothetical protein P153DRAFT_8938 [Dothidotthia symphoricarpi CBS 119687]|uniref:DUF6590 domain-containing protein n=1 Tax=Dothidotthia symphoricarpi CBS 119687 TaxID=1392245 RepID=A0A6A6AW43_9PLEO|nr:uncharacterized protein P153DRAFT_8938 [Dothidotthia symphoricarpi CBS 119687]KAF2134751.1 hypothetical protein P153DRAFT_8938 [Dothidotthia symphoricarpi CBS 119687]